MLSIATTQTPKKFSKTEKQKLACSVLNSYDHILLYGGARSGKTFIAIRNIIIRAIKKPSTHLVVRLRFNHAKQSLWYKTIPDVLRICFPGLKVGENKSDWFLTIPTICGNTSRIWLGGIDDKDRVEKILGNEYSTIYVNEASQIDYDTIVVLRTRLAEMSGLIQRFYVDCNPSGKKHWTYQEFIQGFKPGTLEKHDYSMGHILMNPMDNIANLSGKYIKLLKGMSKRQRQRFFDGLYLSDVEGALWTDQMISTAITRPYGEFIKTIIAVDPAVTNRENSDETGIIVAHLDEFKNAVIAEDLSGKMSTDTWAQRVVNAYRDYEANEVVVEVNQGGDLVSDVLKNKDRSIKVVMVRASKGKFARAEPVSALYERGEVSHMKTLSKLESQLTEYVPLNSKASPDRLDALVWAVTRLCVKKSTQIHVG